MRPLNELTRGLELLEVRGSSGVGIGGLQLNSAAVQPDDLFIAVRGTHTDGHRYIDQAIEKGAAAILCEQIPGQTHPETTYVRVKESARATGPIASAFFGHPSGKLQVVGVTGTNGKTTTATSLYNLFEDLGYPSGLLSTIRIRIHHRMEEATHTTPDAIAINRLLAEMVEEGCSHAFMEVSSHALAQHRTTGIRFAGGIFTNLTRDHLDYHPDFISYLQVKKSFFDSLPAEAFALTNLEDRNGEVMLQNCRASRFTYSSRGVADFEARVVEQHIHGMEILFGGREVWTSLTGRFNVSNLLAVYAAASLLGIDREQLLVALSRLKPVEGRLESVALGGSRTAFVDYAHTPDALDNVLKTLVELRPEGGRIITVFGAGGDRDRGKRPLMAGAACRYSDLVILTSDNPRTEDPDKILQDIREGVPAGKNDHVLSITNRREAIKTAVRLSLPGDVILVAGKGHEPYQEIQGVKHHFDDREELLNLRFPINLTPDT
ncbi:MAG: UDP-N-acetylmuramoyl-L-alanyl-D-glutamate--2,6-diaminopimelate ligase [Bacteroidales bacterium]